MLREPTPNAHAARRRKHDPHDSEAHAHRRGTDDDSVLRLHNRLEDCEESIDKLLQSQHEMSENLKRLTDNTGRLADVLEAWNNVKGFWWTVKGLSAVAKIIGPLLVLMAAIWFFVKTGHWELKP